MRIRHFIITSGVHGKRTKFDQREIYCREFLNVFILRRRTAHNKLTFKIYEQQTGILICKGNSMADTILKLDAFLIDKEQHDLNEFLKLKTDG